MTVLVTSTSGGPASAMTRAATWTAIAAELAVDLLALAGVDARAHVDAELLDGGGDLGGRAERLRRLAERREEPVAGGVLLAAAEALQLGADQPAEPREQLVPARVAELRGQRGRSDDVEEEHRREAPGDRRSRHGSIICLVVHAGNELAAAEHLHRGAGEPHVVAGALREEHLVARLDAAGLGADGGHDARSGSRCRSRPG